MGGSKGSRSRALATAPWSCTHAAAEVVVEEGTRAGGGGGGGERVGSQRAQCPCAPLVSGRGPAGWSRSTCAPCLDPRAQPGRNRKSSVLVSQHERLKLKPSQRCEMEQEQWLNVELFKTWRMVC
eukprot:XP_017171727.1 PREDICTED: uncharacterized protein Gm2237 isoform X3 [Mus musculus]